MTATRPWYLVQAKAESRLAEEESNNIGGAAVYLFWNIVIDVAAHSAARDGDNRLYDFRERVKLKCKSTFIYVRSLIGSLS